MEVFKKFIWVLLTITPVVLFAKVSSIEEGPEKTYSSLFYTIAENQGQLKSQMTALEQSFSTLKDTHDEKLKDFKQDFKDFKQDFKQDIRLNFNEFKQDVTQRFDRVDQRFSEVDKRFDRVDQRFDKIEQEALAFRNETRESKNEILRGIAEMREELRSYVHDFRNATRALEIRIDKLETHWSYNFYDSIVYNPLTYLSLTTGTMGVKIAMIYGASQVGLYSSYGLYALSGLSAEQVIWNLVSPSIPISMADIAHGGIMLLSGASMYALHQNKDRISPAITLNNVGVVTTVGGILFYGKQLAAWVGGLFKGEL